MNCIALLLFCGLALADQLHETEDYPGSAPETLLDILRDIANEPEFAFLNDGILQARNMSQDAGLISMDSPPDDDDLLLHMAISIKKLVKRLKKCETNLTSANSMCGIKHQLEKCLKDLELQKIDFQQQINLNSSATNDSKTCNSRIRPGRWVTMRDGEVPEGAVQSGLGPNKPYYLGRAIMGGNVLPCKLTNPHRVCWTPYNNTEIGVKIYEALVDADVRWEHMSVDKPIPVRALHVGHMNGTKLYVGRAMIGNFLVPGYVFETTRFLLHSSNFKNELKDTYEILVTI